MKLKQSYIKMKTRLYENILRTAAEVSADFGEEGQEKCYQIVAEFWVHEGETKRRFSYFYDSQECMSFLRFASPGACEAFLKRVDEGALEAFYMQ